MSPSKISKRIFLEVGVLTPEEKRIVEIRAGYRNRMVHFYHEISTDEQLEICAGQLGDAVTVRKALHPWYERHQELVDPAL
jgi:uncharacterized protein YutE (UPF0331/DUF86 family)